MCVCVCGNNTQVSRFVAVYNGLLPFDFIYIAQGCFNGTAVNVRFPKAIEATLKNMDESSCKY